jgi:tripartite-type tricarboxylate transporter receptor subunit TctC
MKKYWNRFVRALTAGAVLTAGLSIPAPVLAQNYPAKPVRVMVPFEPGGATDIMARLISAELTNSLGQSFLVENRSGAGGNIGANVVAKADPNGYVLLFAGAGNIAINPSLFTNMPFDPITDLAPVSLMVTTMNVLMVHPSVPAKSVLELIALAKEKPGKLSFASTGNGGTQHLSGELFKMLAGINVVHVPYRGSGPAMADFVVGRTEMMFDNIPPALPRIQAGTLRALGVTAKKRSDMLPGVPTIADAGLPDFEASSWFGVMAPARTPAAVINRLNQAMVEALKKPEVIEKIRGMGADPASSTPEEFTERIRADTEKWRAVVKAAGVTVN